MTWSQIGLNHLLAAKRCQKEFPRSAGSRAYCAAHVALTEALTSDGYSLPAGRQTPPHESQEKLIGVYLGHKGERFVRTLGQLMRRLRAARLVADYSGLLTLNETVARSPVRDAASVFALLGLR